MARIARWAVFLFSIYALVVTMMAYVAHPESIVEFFLTNPRNLALLCFAIVACCLTGMTIFRDYRRRDHAESVRQDARVLSTSGEHPFVLAFKKHPGFSALIVLLLLSLPFLSVFTFPLGEQSLGLAHWCIILLGELLIVGGGVLAWIRAKPGRSGQRF